MSAALSLVSQAAALFLLLTIAAGLVRIWRGPTPADRLLAVQLFGTTGTAALLLLALGTDNDAFRNTALIFALLAGILGVVFVQYGKDTGRVEPKEAAHDAE